MKKFYIAVLFLIIITGCFSCQTNSKATNQLTDSLMAANSSDSSILVYALGLEKLSDALIKKESPVFTKGDYSFYAVIYSRDSVPVIYKEYGDSGEYGFTTKKYYLNNGELVLYIQKDKQSTGGEKPSYDFRETRVFFRNDVFLRADERKAESDSLLNQTPFTLLDESLVDKNQQFNFQKMEDAVRNAGEFSSSFSRLDSVSSRKTNLILSSANGYESVYQVTKPDSLIYMIKASPYIYKGKKLDLKYTRQGTNMIYDSGKLAAY